ncbi:MAG: phosphoserine phosphatase SerB [Hydrogenovibrio sp.]
MMTLIIHENALSYEQTKELTRRFGTPQKVDNHFRIQADAIETDKIKALSEKWQIDLNIFPDHFDPAEVKLLISDMDSTLIGIECVDEIADMMALKPQVAAITEAAMRGEIDFAASLTQRVALLAGLETSALERVYDERLFLNPGAEAWLKGLKARQIAFALVSGGFTFFTERLKTKLQLDFSRANVLAEENGRLTGKVVGDIVGAEAKAEFLHELCQQLTITPEQTIAVGDGANDLNMMHQAGLSVAYHAKPAVQAQADVAINYGGLDKVLDFIATP